MLESIITISIAGFIAGIIFAMPIAGPVSILVVSSALNGRKRYSYQAGIGAAISDFLIIFVAIYGLTSLYPYYKPVIPYLLFAGAVFFLFLGIKIFRTPVNLGNLGEASHLSEKIKEKGRGGFYTGFMMNIFNPTLFITGLISSFFVLSLISSLGLSTGGLEIAVNDKVKEISSIEGAAIQERLQSDMFSQFKHEEIGAEPEKKNYPSYFRLVISLCYALFIALGGLVWFYFLAYMLTKYRRLMNIRVISALIKLFGICLGVLAFYFTYLGIQQFR